jgi:amidase
VRDDGALLDATAQADLVGRGEVTALELVDAAIARIEALDDELHAVIHRRFEEARAEAIDPRLAHGTFRGVPLLVKDLGAGGQVPGSPSHLGNRALRDVGFVYEGRESHVVRRLRAAGFVIVGKTNTPELGFSVTTEPIAHGATHNPWDLTRTPAGSSGGSAAAVAAGLVPIAHGTDGGGSIRMPASACGLVGLKVSRGRISAGPNAGEPGAGRAVEGCLATTVRDAAAMLDVLAGAEPGDPVIAPASPTSYADAARVDPGRVRIGVRTSGAAGLPVHPDCVAAVEHTGRVLEALGHHVDVSAPDALDETQIGLEAILPVHAATMAVSVDDVAGRLGREVHEDDFEPRTWEQATIGRGYGAPQLVRASEAIVAWGRRMAAWWADHDLLLTTTLGTPPPLLGNLAWTAPDAAARAIEFNPLCPVWNWTGQPSISLPIATTRDGALPVGIMLTAAYAREDLLIRVAAQLERAAPWSGRTPPVHAASPDARP